MKILSHRGYWKDKKEKNQEIAFKRSFELQFGTETDVRDLNGKLVISHDIPTGNEMLFTDFLALLQNKDLPIALNIKSDGLAKYVIDAVRQFELTNAFVFDMSIPDMRSYLNSEIDVFTRISEVEIMPAFLEQSFGIWLDSFSDTWYGKEQLDSLFKLDKQICVVSSELHGRDPKSQWDVLLPYAGYAGLMLCTDIPEVAAEFFGKRND